MEPIKYISPSSFYYWRNCPLKAIYSHEYNDFQIFPKHPDADLGSLIHSFFENKNKWDIYSIDAFEAKWEAEILKLNKLYKESSVQKIYYPINWNTKYYAVKKLLLKHSLLKNISKSETKHVSNCKFEIWIDDNENIGGRVDFMLLNGMGEIIEIVDFKTGNVFELEDNKQVLKRSYTHQLILYAYVIKEKQKFYPKCYIQDIKGNKFQVDIKEEIASEIYKAAKELKNKINKHINDGNIDQLANPSYKNCSHCDYRPLCNQYKLLFINKFENKQVDICGEVIQINGIGKVELKMKIENKMKILKGISTIEEIKIGDMISIFNLYCPDGDSHILFAMKQTVIKHE